MGDVKHTPGPWYPGHMVDDGCSCNCRTIVDEGYAGGIATVHIDNGIRSIADGGNDSPPLDEAKANARLIAAAPDMLAALRRADCAIVELYRAAFPDGNYDYGNNFADNCPEMGVIRAALAKAEASPNA